jgi:uncharacterized protein YuzE
MRIQYFKETDTLSIRLNDAPSIESEEIAPDVVIDFDESGGVGGIEIDLASSKVDLKSLDLKGLLIPELLSRAIALHLKY